MLEQPEEVIKRHMPEREVPPPTPKTSDEMSNSFGSDKSLAAPAGEMQEEHLGGTQDPSTDTLGLDKLTSDPDFMRSIDEISKQAFKRYSAISTYTWQELRDEVLIKYRRWLGGHRGSANPGTILKALATNHLIDVYRKQSARRYGHTVIALNEVGREELPDEKSGEYIEQNILVKECLQHLSGRERELFEDYIIKGKTLTEIADERGITRQAVSNMWERILKKIRVLLGTELEETQNRLKRNQKETDRLKKETLSYIEDLQAQ